MTEVSSAPTQLLPGQNYQATNNSGVIFTATQRGTSLAATSAVSGGGVTGGGTGGYGGGAHR